MLETEWGALWCGAKQRTNPDQTTVWNRIHIDLRDCQSLKRWIGLQWLDWIMVWLSLRVFVCSSRSRDLMSNKSLKLICCSPSPPTITTENDVQWAYFVQSSFVYFFPHFNDISLQLLVWIMGTNVECTDLRVQFLGPFIFFSACFFLCARGWNCCLLTCNNF